MLHEYSIQIFQYEVNDFLYQSDATYIDQQIKINYVISLPSSPSFEVDESAIARPIIQRVKSSNVILRT